MVQRVISGADVIGAVTASGSKLPVSSLPVGTTSGTVADGAAVATISAAASAATAASTAAASAVSTLTTQVGTLATTVSTVQTSLTGYATSSSVTATVNTSIAGLASTYVLQAALSNYTTLSQMNSAISGFVTSTALTSTLQGFATTANMNAAITARLPVITPDSTGIHFLLADGTTGNVLFDSVTAAPGAGTVYTLASAGTMVPNTFISIDAALPASQNALVAGTAGIRLNDQGEVLEMIEPINKYRATAGYGRVRRVTSGPGGFPFFQGTSSSYNNAYDSLTLLPSLGMPMFGPDGGTWAVTFVMRQTGPGASGLMVAQSSSGTYTLILGGGSDGALRVEQNDGAAGGNEASSSATAFNVWQIVEVTCDGSKMAIYRNGVRTLETGAGKIGGFAEQTKFFFLNNPQADVALVEVMTGVGSVAQRNARVALLATRYGITVATITQGSSTQISPVPIDQTNSFLRYPNFPISDTLPTRGSVVPGNGITLASGAAQKFSLLMGSGQSGANVLTTTDLYKYVYTRYLVGNQTDMTDMVNSTGQGDPPFYARARHYADGDPNNLHFLASDGLRLRAIYSKNHTDGSNGNVYGGMIRLPAVFKPGSLIKVRYKSYAGAHGWAPIWLYSGEQRTPGPGGNPFSGYGTNNALIRTAGGGRSHEIDINDNYPRPDTGTPVGQQLDFGEPDIYGMQWTGTAPHKVWSASGSGYTFFPSASPPHLRNANINWQSSFNDIYLNWRGDGSNLLDIFQNGQLVQTDYMEYDKADTYVDPSGITQQLGMHLIIGNQAKARFTPGTDASTPENDGITEGWTITVQEITAWTGNVLNPDSYRATA